MPGPTFTTEIPGTLQTTAPNSSPVLETVCLLWLLCAGFDFFFDHSATDLDGGQSGICTVALLCLEEHPMRPAPNPPNGPAIHSRELGAGFILPQNPIDGGTVIFN